MGVLARIAGPRVLLGVVIAGGVGIATFIWLWQGALEDAATARGETAEYRRALEHTAAELERRLADRRRLDAAIAERRARERAAEQRARAAEQRLRELEATDAEVRDWSSTRVPAAVRGWLQRDAAAGDDHEGGQGESTGESVPPVPDPGAAAGDQRGSGKGAAGTSGGTG